MDSHGIRTIGSSGKYFVPQTKNVTSVRKWKNIKASEKKKLKKSRLSGGLEEWNRIKRERINLNQYKRARQFHKVKREMKVIEEVKEKIREECIQKWRKQNEQKKNDNIYMAQILEYNSSDTKSCEGTAFHPDDRDHGLQGWPMSTDSDDDV